MVSDLSVQFARLATPRPSTVYFRAFLVSDPVADSAVGSASAGSTNVFASVDSGSGFIRFIVMTRSLTESGCESKAVGRISVVSDEQIRSVSPCKS